VVRPDINPSFYRILQAYERRTGLGLMINTSFNMHEEPIVATPQDALRALGQGAVDLLAIEDFLVYPDDETKGRRKEEALRYP
jgi:carbamoyltransferase